MSRDHTNDYAKLAELGGYSDDCASALVVRDGIGLEPFGEYSDKRVRFIAADGSELVAELRYDDGWVVQFSATPGTFEAVPEERRHPMGPWTGEEET